MPDYSVPVLETERLRLRGHRPVDLEHCLAMWSDPRVIPFLGGKPLTREDVWNRILRYAGSWALLGYGFWLVEDRHTGEFLGEAGLLDGCRDMDPPLNEGPEVGWALAASAQGKGYATEAVKAALAWTNADQTVCMIHPDNTASLRVAEKYGYRELRRSTYKGHPTTVLIR